MRNMELVRSNRLKWTYEFSVSSCTGRKGERVTARHVIVPRSSVLSAGYDLMKLWNHITHPSETKLLYLYRGTYLSITDYCERGR
jgi:hypothetical protein